MELDELKTIWSEHEKLLIEHTEINTGLLKKLLVANTEKRIDWLKVRTLASLILPLVLIVFVALPRIEFTFTFKVVFGFVLVIPLFVISYFWAIRLYLLIERLDFNKSVLSVSKQLRIVEKYKLKITKYNLILAPFMVVGIFLSAGIPFLSSKMIPFYVLMVISFLIGTYIRTKHGLSVQIRKIDRDLEEISKLELDIE